MKQFWQGEGKKMLHGFFGAMLSMIVFQVASWVGMHVSELFQFSCASATAYLNIKRHIG